MPFGIPLSNYNSMQVVAPLGLHSSSLKGCFEQKIILPKWHKTVF